MTTSPLTDMISSRLLSAVLCATLFSCVDLREVRAQDEIARRPVLYSVPQMEAVVLRPAVPYKGTAGDGPTMDLYYPPEAERANALPVVVFAFGYSDAAAQRITGRKLKDVVPYTSWATLVAASGMVAVTYETTNPEPDLRDLITFLRAHAQELGVDADRIGIWSCSGNVPVALAYLMREPASNIKAGVFYYGLMPTPDRFQEAQIDSLAQQFGFVPSHLHAADHLRRDVPLLVVRAGRDHLRPINASIDRFTEKALADNVPLTLINYPEGRHGFDLLDDQPQTREIIRQTLDFFIARLISDPGVS